MTIRQPEQESVQKPRSGMIELLQLLSVLMIPVAYLIEEVRIPAVCASVVLAGIPFLLVQRLERRVEDAAAPPAERAAGADPDSGARALSHQGQ